MKKIARTVLKVYLLRWKIEEYFKFKKQQDKSIFVLSVIKKANAIFDKNKITFTYYRITKASKYIS